MFQDNVFFYCKKQIDFKYIYILPERKGRKKIHKMGTVLFGSFFFIHFDIFQFPRAGICYFHFLNLRKVVKVLCGTV